VSIESTIEKLNALKLYGMVRIIKDTKPEFLANLSHDEVIAMMTDAENDLRAGNKINRLFASSGLRGRASSENIDYSASRGLDRNTVRRLADCTYIDKGESIAVTGPTGAGKSFLAQALGNEACARGYSVQYYGFTKLMNHLRIGRADHSYEKMMNKLNKVKLLILDDFGLEVLDSSSRLAFYEILEERYDRKSLILVSQIPVKSWHSVIGEATVADAICDRLINGSHSLQLKGDSFRRKKELPV